MPKIYIFHKLQGILQCYGLIMVPILFLANWSSHYGVTHTLFMAKVTAENLHWKYVVQLGDPAGGKRAFLFIWLEFLSAEIPPFLLIHVSLNY